MVEWASRFRGEHAAADYRREIPLPVADRTAARGINIAQHVGSTIDRDRRDAKSAQSATRMEPINVSSALHPFFERPRGGIRYVEPLMGVRLVRRFRSAGPPLFLPRQPPEEASRIERQKHGHDSEQGIQPCNAEVDHNTVPTRGYDAS